MLKSRPEGSERRSYVDIPGNRRLEKWQVQRP